MEGKTDLRVLRTQKSIHNALFSLMEEKSYDEITVMEIAERAFINRNTFYLHYRDKDDLLRTICEPHLRHIAETLCGTERGTQIMLENSKRVLQTISQHQDFYRVMFGKSGPAYFMDHLHDLLAGQLMKNLSLNGKTEFQNMFCAEYILNGYLGALRFALEQPGKIDPEELNGLIFQLMFNNPLGLFEQ